MSPEDQFIAELSGNTHRFRYNDYLEAVFFHGAQTPEAKLDKMMEYFATSIVLCGNRPGPDTTIYELLEQWEVEIVCRKKG